MLEIQGILAYYRCSWTSAEVTQPTRPVRGQTGHTQVTAVGLADEAHSAPCSHPAPGDGSRQHGKGPAKEFLRGDGRQGGRGNLSSPHVQVRACHRTLPNPDCKTRMTCLDTLISGILKVHCLGLKTFSCKILLFAQSHLIHNVIGLVLN